jgi:Spy/CpxP family protein refolding chaperone
MFYRTFRENKVMKKLQEWFLVTTVIAFLMAGVAALAQEGNPSGEHHHGGGAARMLAELQQKLSLTPDQSSRIKTMLEDFHQKNQGQRPSAEARQALHQQIMGVLTPAQQTLFKEMMAEHAQHRHHHDQ